MTQIKDINTDLDIDTYNELLEYIKKTHKKNIDI